jgi:hypothetical protein
MLTLFTTPIIAALLTAKRPRCISKYRGYI